MSNRNIELFNRYKDTFKMYQGYLGTLQSKSFYERFKNASGNDEINRLVAFDNDNKDFCDTFKENQDIGVIDLLSMVIEED